MKKYLLIASLFLFSCEGDETNDTFNLDDPDSETPDLSGEWQFSGEGEQSSCIEKLDNVSYQIEIVDEWQVVATKTGNVDQDGFEEYELNLSSSPQFVSGFTGLVQGEDVSFEFDDTGAVETVSYSFLGKIVSSSKVNGSFSAQGPGSCVTPYSSSSFNLTIL